MMDVSSACRGCITKAQNGRMVHYKGVRPRKVLPKGGINNAIIVRRVYQRVSEGVQNENSLCVVIRLLRSLKYNCHAARGQGSICFDPVLEIASSGFQQQNKRLAFRAGVVGVRERIECQWVDGVPEPAVAVDVAVYEIVSSVGFVNVRRVVALENCQAKSDRSNQGGRRGVPERAGIVEDVSEGAIRRLERTSAIKRVGRCDRAGRCLLDSAMPLSQSLQSS